MCIRNSTLMSAPQHLTDKERLVAVLNHLLTTSSLTEKLMMAETAASIAAELEDDEIEACKNIALAMTKLPETALRFTKPDDL